MDATELAAEVIRLRAQVAAADKLADACMTVDDHGMRRCLCCAVDLWVVAETPADYPHFRNCKLAAYLASRAP